MRLSELRGRRVAIWGFRMEGRSVFELLRAWGDTAIRVIDDDAAVAAAGTGTDVPVETGPAAAGALRWAEVVVKSPGISVHEEPVVALRRHKPVVGPTSLWLAERGGARSVGVTGTKGKSTTTAFLAHLLGTLGHQVRLAGNIGQSVVDLALPAPPGSIDVIEISSYQAEDVTVSPEFGVFTSFFPEHLDWHKTVPQYLADKTNLFRHGPAGVAVPDAAIASLLREAGVAAPLLSATHTPAGGERFGAASPQAVALSLAAAELLGLGCEADQLAEAQATFGSLPCRQEIVLDTAEVTVVDDALATIPQATIACVERAGERPVSLIVGGLDRQVDPAGLIDVLAARTEMLRAYGLPDTGHRIVAALQERGAPQGMATAVETVEEAVAAALASARPGEVLLLSPGAASYNRHSSYRELSARFRAAVADSLPLRPALSAHRE